MTQIVSTLASSLQGAWHPSHTPASQSALHPLLTDDMFLLDLLPGLAACSRLSNIPHGVQPTSTAQQGGRLHQAGQLRVLASALSILREVKTSLVSRPVANLLVFSDNWLADPGCWAEVVSLSSSRASSSAPLSSWRKTWPWWTSSSRGDHDSEPGRG